MIPISDLMCIVNMNLKHQAGKEEQNVTRYCVHDEGFTEYGVIQSLMLSWGILFYISSYLSALNSLCRIQQRPWMMGYVVPGMYALPQPVQKSRSFRPALEDMLSSPASSIKGNTPGKNRILLFILMPPALHSHPAIYTRGHRATNFADTIP